jgi:hypothetical protein
MQSIASTSPDNKHDAILEYLSEIRFGPAYYPLMINKIFFGERIFGVSYLCSRYSRYFAIQEWEMISEGGGPQTHLLLIDVETEREGILSRAEKGFIRPKNFEGDKCVYRKEYFAPRRSIEFEIEILSVKSWKNLDVQGHI